MDDGLKWEIRKFGGLKSFLFGGEGFVIEVEGLVDYIFRRGLSRHS